MTRPSRPISVRLDAALEAALDEFCARAGVTRSLAVQEGLAQYLVSRHGPTLSSLAEEILPPLPVQTAATRKSRAPPQQRYREYVRERRHR